MKRLVGGAMEFGGSVLVAAAALAAAGAARAAPPVPMPVPVPTPVKVMIVSMFAPEGDVWLRHRRMDRVVPVPGLPADHPAVRCDAEGACQVTIGMGYANAAASMGALVYSGLFDLRSSYWLIAGVAGIDPERGTLGSATWPRFLVDGGLQWELDARDMPRDWPGGYLGIGVARPGDRPRLEYGTELFELDPALVQRAVALSATAPLADAPQAARTRSAYPPPANRPPSVLQCDTVSDDTWMSGPELSEHAARLTRLLTGGRGTQCTTQQEDNATYAVLSRATAAGLANDRRVLVLRTASDFDRPPPGGDAARSLLGFRAQGGFAPAIANLVRAGDPVLRDILSRWDLWARGVPPA